MVSELEENNKNELIFAYIAGIIDGDGAIVALIESKRIRIEISLYNNCRDVIEFMKKTYKFGKIYTRKWSIKTNSGSCFVLQSIAPYLFVKQRQCKLALKLISLKDIQEQKIIALAINELNTNAKKVFSVCTDSHLNDL